MPLFICEKLRKLARDLKEAARRDAISDIKDEYGIEVKEGPDECIDALYSGLKRMPKELVRDCGIKTLAFKDLGPSKEYYPNHGIYCNNVLTLNTQLLEDPMLDIEQDSDCSLNKFDQTLFHELGHGWDEIRGDKNGFGSELSFKPEWINLSGWSEEPKTGLRRIVIKESGSPELRGEWCYSPDADFTRFYAKRNPWDDWADSFAYYVGGLKSFLPENKIKYFDDKLGSYY